MGSKTISLDEEAYERLAHRKRVGESLSDVVKRLAGERSWTEVAGIWEDESDELEAVIDEARDRSRNRADDVADALDSSG